MSNDTPSLPIRAVWFVFVGWWATGILLTIAYLLNLTIVLIPLGIKAINLVPKALTLKDISSADDVETVQIGGSSSSGNSPSLIIRGVYFVFIGWWASGIWMTVAYFAALTVIGLPIAVMMFNYLPYVVSLYKA